MVLVVSESKHSPICQDKLLCPFNTLLIDEIEQLKSRT